MDNKKKISTLLAIILEASEAGGLSNEESEKIYNQLMSSLVKIHPSNDQFNMLLKDILDLWALPTITSFGVDILTLPPKSDN
jgi:hypothetical protein